MKISFEKNEDCGAASAEATAAFERERSVVLPADYRAFASPSPGGSRTPEWCSFGGTNGDFVMYIYGIHRGAQWRRLSYAVAQFGHDLSQCLPVAVSSGETIFFFVFRSQSAGPCIF